VLTGFYFCLIMVSRSLWCQAILDELWDFTKR
jgi:hypothetical protein